MEELNNIIIEELKALDIYKLKLKNENQFEDYIFQKLDILLKKYDKNILLKRQMESNRESRKLKPDIIVGLNEILIELKYDIKNLNEIYRLFYQAVKYSRIAKESLIIYVYDPQKKITNEDLQDLEMFDKVKVLRKI